jgi:hypothetical protein
MNRKVLRRSGQYEESLTEILEEHLELRRSLNIRRASGKPRIEEDQLLLLKPILHTGMHGSASHDKRPSDIHRNIKTLD